MTWPAPPAPEYSRAVTFVAFVALAGCAVSAPTLTPDDDIAVLTYASWTAGTDARTRVEVDDAEGPFLRTTWQEPAATHRVPLLGLPPGADYTARVVSEDGDASEVVPFSTGVPPAELPNWTTSGAPGWEGYLLTGLVGDGSWAVILDQDGRVVWYRKARQKVLRVRVRPDGAGLRYSEIEAAEITENSQLVTVDWDGTERARHTVPEFNHDFVDDDDGAVLCLVTDVRAGRSGTDVIGDALVRVDADGAITPMWSTWDTWEVPPDSQLAGGSQWTHANALDVREGGGWWLGMRNLSQLVELDEDFEVGRILGGDNSTYTFADEADRPKWQHQFEFIDGGVVLFDDRVPNTGDPSRVLELELDDAAGTARARWTWTHPQALEVVILGDVDRADDGSTLVVFSSSGVIDDVSPEGELRWELATDVGTILPYVERVATLPGMERVR